MTMRRFFGYGVQAISANNGVVSVRPLSGFGASGITNLQTGETAGMMPNSLPTPMMLPTGAIRTAVCPQDGKTVITASSDYEAVSKCDAIFGAGSTMAAKEAPKLTFTSSQIASMFNVGLTFAGLVGVGTKTPGSPPPAAPPSGLPPGYNVYGPCPEDGKTSVAARSEAEALAMCAAKFKARVGGGDTMKYVLIGGAALVALLLLKK
jgi:hypothetical protein